MKASNRVLALILSVLIMVSTMSVLANAATVSDFYDFPAGSWSEEAMTAAVNNDLLKGRGNGSIAPKDYITRAEAVAVINRAFGATVKADISGYTDVKSGAWYYDEIAKAVNMQTIVGVSSNRIDPNGYITRESMLSVLARALVLDDGKASSLSKFVDDADVSAWAKAQVAAMAERGYVNGNEKGELNPKSYITREEFAQVMHNIFRIYIPKTVTVEGVTYGTTIIRAKDVTLNNVTINGDLIAGDGVGSGNLNLTNVNVTGRILFRGGEGNVTLTNTTVGERVVINDVNGIVNFLNYRAEDPFKNIQENTKATFLNLKVNSGGGGGSSTPSRVEYKIREYVQNIDGSYPSSPKYTDEKMADYGKTITYNPRTMEGFTFDATHPDSVLSGTNKGKLILEAYYTRNKYKVSFYGYEVELPYGQNISKDDPLKDKMQETIDTNKEAGYKTEFNTKEDGTGKKVTINDTIVGAEDLPIYAIKTPIEYKINYDLNGGTIVGTYDKTYNVEEGVTLPAYVVKKGYTFGGWIDENGRIATVIQEGTKGDKTFTATWNIVTYNITYVPGENGTMDGVAAKTTYTVEDGTYKLPEPIVTKQDYVFKGWYTTANFTGRPITVLNPQDAEDKTYYARIEERTYEQYTIKFDGKTYTVTEGEKIGDAVDRNGNKLSDAMDNVTYPKGYEADNFRIKGDDTTVITKDTVAIGDMEIVAAKKAIVYTITYVLNDGKFEGVIPKTEYTVEDNDYTLPVPEKTDYNFLGWFEKADFSDTEVKILDTADAENKTYYANWKKVTYTITFNGTQYTVEKDAKISEATDKNGNKLGTAMDNVTYPKGYEADGFHIKGNTSAAVTKDTPATDNMEIVAAKKAIVYTITYVLGGGSLDGTQKTEYTVEDPDYTLPKPTKAGSTFLGWYENGTKVTKLDTADAENKIYTADWSEPVADVYKITFDGKEYDVTEDKALSTNEELKDAMDEALDKPGYDVSFNTKPDGTGENIDTSYIPEGDMIIHIIEVAKEYTITYIENGGNDVADDTYTIKDADITLPVPTRSGYVFRGWYEEADFSGTVVTVLDTADLENKTYYAKWVLDNAVLSFDHEVNGDVVTLKVMLNAIPADIDDIAAMSIRYDFDDTKLEYVSTTSNVGEVTAASAGYISWYTTSNYITADTLEAKDNVLFTITFNVKDDQYGTTEVSYSSTEITASAPVGNPQVAEKYTKESETIDLGTPSETYTIKYVENGGDDIPDGSYTVNDADITLPIPTRADYAFKGWYEEADFSGEAVKVLDTADAEDKTYYAKWVIETATLDFSAEINGNNITIYVTLDEIPSDIDDIAAFTLKYKHPENKLVYDALNPATTEFGGSISSQDGYISWYTDAAAITSENLKANGNILVTLHFVKEDSASGLEKFEFTQVELVASEPIISPATATKYVADTEDVQLDAATYVVTFNGQTYNITAGKALSSNALLVAEMNKALNKSGYNVSFNTKEDGSGENVTTAYVPESSMTVYVVEKTIDYSITYELDGGTLDGTEKTSYTVEDADYTLPTPSKDNYDFLGWYENGVKVEVLDTADAEDKTYTAKWEATEYTITYELDGGALDGTQKISYTVEDADYTLPTPSKDNYDFLGWYENGVRVEVLDTADAEDKTYTAKWEATEYTITYVLDGGALDGTEKTSYTVEDADYTLPTPAKDNYDFLGWYENGVKVEILDTADAENKTYTAKWEATEYTITYELDGGALDGTEKTSYTVEDADYTLPTPTKSGYTFLGWYENGVKVETLDTADAENKTYIAKWFSEVATLDFKAETDGNKVKVHITLEDIPSDIDDIAAFTLKFKHPDNQLEYVSASTAFAGNFSVNDGYISWYNENTPITGDVLEANGKILATIEYSKPESASGVETFEYTFVEIVASEPKNNPTIATSYKTDKEEVQLGESTEETYTITYVTNGGTLDGTQWTTYTTSSALPYTLPIPQKDEVPFLGWYEDEACTGEAVTALVAGSTGNKTYYAKWQEYTLQFYLGTKITRNKPVSDDGDRGQMIVEHGATLTQADVDRELGMLPSEYKGQEGYTDSDGVVHKIVPELWYQKNGEWTKFVPEEIEVVSDMDIHLFIRFVSMQYNTDLKIKGIDMSKLDFSLEVPYDSYTDIGKTYLDLLTNTGETMRRVLDGIEDQGYDLYQMAIDKAASKSLVDSDGNIMNPNVPIPLHKFITKQFITDEIDAYIDAHLHDDEFIADLISNDHVHEQLISDEGLRERLLTDDKSKNIIKDEIIDNKDDEAIKNDIKDALKADLKKDTSKMLGDSQIRDALIDAVEEYLASEGVSYVSADEAVDKYADGSLKNEYPELYDDIVKEYNSAFEDKYDSYFDRNYDQLMDDNFDSYFDDTVEAYLSHTISSELKSYIDDKLVWYEEKLINDFISGADRTLLHNAIPDYAADAVAAIKKTSTYNGPINDFVSGKGVRVNEDNLVFIEVLDSIMHKYDYESLTKDVLPANLKQIVDLVGREVAEEYVNKYLEVFCTGMDDAIAKLNADLEAGITGTEYKFSTSPATRINYMEIMDYYYSGVSGKLSDKINSQSKIPVSSNPYAQRIVDMDYFELYFDRTGEETEYKSGYKLKDDVMEYYYNTLELEILMHDAVTFYGSMDTYAMEDRLDSASLLIGTYANKANDAVMNFIENGELPKGYTLEDILALDARIEGLYNKFEDKIQKGEDIYAEYLDRDYTNVVDLANMSIYSDGDSYKIYQIILENGEDAFDFDDAVTAIFDSPNYRGISKIEDAMAKVEAKIKSYAYTPESDIQIYYVDAYKGAVESKEIKGYETGTHTLALQRFLRYYK